MKKTFLIVLGLFSTNSMFAYKEEIDACKIAVTALSVYTVFQNRELITKYIQDTARSMKHTVNIRIPGVSSNALIITGISALGLSSFFNNGNSKAAGQKIAFSAFVTSYLLYQIYKSKKIKKR